MQKGVGKGNGSGLFDSCGKFDRVSENEFICMGVCTRGEYNRGPFSPDVPDNVSEFSFQIVRKNVEWDAMINRAWKKVCKELTYRYQPMLLK